ncbi:hypothetical protein VmeM32_00040 [Vibrio phage vB_VmeM-32]|nr:hypothetical protein VmeM32_00040 [Vibrio phage vB_VmeM-32]
MMLLTDIAGLSIIKIDVSSTSGSISFKIFDKFYYRRICNLRGKGPAYIRLNKRQLNVTEFIL